MSVIPKAVIFFLNAEELPLGVAASAPLTTTPRVLLSGRSEIKRLLNSDEALDVLRAVPALSRVLTGGESGYTHQWYNDLARSEVTYAWHNKAIHPPFEAHADARWSVQIRIRRAPPRRAGSALAKAILHILNKVAYTRGLRYRPRVVDIAYSIQPREIIAVVLLDGRGVYAVNSVRCAQHVRLSSTQQLVVTYPAPQSVHALPPDTLLHMCEIAQYLVTPASFAMRGGGIRGNAPRLTPGVPGPEARVGMPLQDISNNTVRA